MTALSYCLPISSFTAEDLCTAAALVCATLGFESTAPVAYMGQVRKKQVLVGTYQEDLNKVDSPTWHCPLQSPPLPRPGEVSINYEPGKTNNPSE